jgi:hypothetical protein
MVGAANTRKRPAPESSPSPQQAMTRSLAQQQMQYPDPQGLSDAQFLRWGEMGTPDVSFPDLPGTYPRTNYSGQYPNFQPMQTPVAYPTSNQLVRRNNNQQALVRQQGYEDEQSQNRNSAEVGDEEDDLDKQAAQAMADHQAHRKPIPPFVQKLAK